MPPTLSRMSVAYPLFVAIVCGLLLAGMLAIPSGVLAVRYGLARGIKVIGTALLPLVGLGGGIALLWMNPVEGEYRVSIWLLLIGALGPFAAVFDLRRVLAHRRETGHAGRGRDRQPSSADELRDRLRW